MGWIGVKVASEREILNPEPSDFRLQIIAKC